MYSPIVLPIRRLVAASVLAFCALLVMPCYVYSQVCGGAGIPGSVTNLGTEFLLCFMQNEAPNSDISANQDIYLASAGDTTTVTITCKAFPNFKKVYFLQKNEALVYHISSDPGIHSHDATMETDALVDQTVIRVVCTTPIACYGMNSKQYTADAFLALPRSVASTEYRVMAYYNSSQGGSNMPSEFAVAAFDSNTTVKIWPSAVTQSGDTPDPNKPLVYILNAGEGVQIHADPDIPLLDLTGSRIESDKPIVVFGGSQRTEAPNGYAFNDQGGSQITRDHLCEEIPPTSAWGYSFVTKNFGRVFGDVVRVLAWKDNTVVKINGQVWGTPLAHDTYRDYIFDLSDSAVGNVISVESDPGHTILVGMIAHSGPDARNGDPFLAIVPPVDQPFNDYTYFITKDFTTYYPNEQFLIIVTEQSETGNIFIDDTLVPALAFTSIPGLLNNGKHYAAATINQPIGGTHRIRTFDPNGFTILAYGWGEKISYGYTAGGKYQPHSGIMPKTLPSLNAAPGQGDHTPVLPPPSITVRNIIMEKVYFDSAQITYTQNPHNIPVRLKDDITMVTQTIGVAEERTLELTTPQAVSEVISGSVRIWYHSKMWTDMYPVDFPFTITPQSRADVKSVAGQTVVLENYPNPVSGRTSVHFTIPQRASVSVRIFDALGRVVRTVVQSVVNSGEQEYQVSTKGFTPGEYTLELLAPELGISEHRKMIVIE